MPGFAPCKARATLSAGLGLSVWLAALLWPRPGVSPLILSGNCRRANRRNLRPWRSRPLPPVSLQTNPACCCSCNQSVSRTHWQPAQHASPRGASAHLSRNESPQLLDVDGGAVELVQRLVEVPHTDLTEVTRVAARKGPRGWRSDEPWRRPGGRSRLQRWALLPVRQRNHVCASVAAPRQRAASHHRHVHEQAACPSSPSPQQPSRAPQSARGGGGSILFVHHDPVVVLAASVTTTTRVLPVLADTALAVRHITAQLARRLALLSEDRLRTPRRQRVRAELSESWRAAAPQGAQQQQRSRQRRMAQRVGQRLRRTRRQGRGSLVAWPTMAPRRLPDAKSSSLEGSRRKAK